MSIKERELIETIVSDFSTRQDVLIRMKYNVSGLDFDIDYIPDRYLLVAESVEIWIKEYNNWQGTHEWLALNILDDINNEVVPRWVRVSCQVSSKKRILIEDKQPHWRVSSVVDRINLI